MSGKPHFFENDNRQLVGIFGSLLLFVGVFLPLIRIPIVGSLNYFQNGRGDGTIVLIAAAISMIFALLKKYQPLWATGGVSLAALLFTFLNFQFAMSAMQAQMRKDLAGNPFAGLGNMALGSVQLDWGWAVLALGAACVLGAAALESLTESRSSAYKKFGAVGILLAVVASVSYVNTHKSHSRSNSNMETEATTNSRKSPHGEGESSPEKKYLPKVALSEVSGGYSFGTTRCLQYEGKKCASFSGKIKNTGDRPLREVEVIAYFPDEAGNIVFESKHSPVLALRDFALGNNEPLKPGYIRDFGYVVEDCPSECVPKNVRVIVTNVEFLEKPGENN